GCATMRSFIASSLVAALAFSTAVARADDPTGAPPPDAKALVAAPAATADVPVVDTPNDDTTVALSAGGQFVTGNSRLLAGTVNGKLNLRRGADGFGAELLGNYGQGAPPGQAIVETAQNIQGRVRYDRYLIEKLSLFLSTTGRNDKFQGIEFRLNVDPGAKYLFVNTDPTTFWGEAGYDFQYDDRYNAALVQVDDAGMPIPGAPLLPKTQTDNSARLYTGFKHAFNKEVTLTTGLEYLQSFQESTQYRL